MSADSDMSERRLSQGQEKKGPWSPEEDESLRLAVNSCSPRPKWAEIANCVPGRSAKQCRERWEQNLSPRLNKHPINRDESIFIVRFVESQGKKWAEIARQLTDRSDNNIKNWYNGMVQKGKTGRGPQDDELRRHFSPENQNWLNNRGKRSVHRSNQVEHQHPGTYHAYGVPQPSYPTPSGTPYEYPQSFGGQQLPPPPPSTTSYHAPAPQYPQTPSIPGMHAAHHHHHHMHPYADHQPVQLAPLQTAAPTPQRREMSHYFEQRSSGLSLQTDAHYSPTMMTKSREGSFEMPGLCGSTSSTPMQGSPMTPVSPHSDIYRRREASTSADSMDVDESEKPVSTGQKMSIMSIMN